jgi:hypothetical protein
MLIRSPAAAHDRTDKELPAKDVCKIDKALWIFNIPYTDIAEPYLEVLRREKLLPTFAKSITLRQLPRCARPYKDKVDDSLARLLRLTALDSTAVSSADNRDPRVHIPYIDKEDPARAE